MQPSAVPEPAEGDGLAGANPGPGSASRGRASGDAVASLEPGPVPVRRDESFLGADEHAAFLLSIENVQGAAARQLGGHPDQESVIAFVGHLQLGVDKVVGEHIQRGAKPDCKPGCSYCCRARVEALPAEIFRISRHLLQRPGSLLQPLMAGLQEQLSSARDPVPWKDRRACAFLERGLCSIYEVRPASCRKAHSLDVARCASGAAEIPENLGLVLDAEALMKGVSNAYQQLGLESSGVELAGAVLLALSDRTAEARWYRGERVFRPLAMPEYAPAQTQTQTPPPGG